MKIAPGISIHVSPFGWLKRKVAKATGIPTTRSGRHAKVGRLFLRALRGR